MDNDKVTSVQKIMTPIPLEIANPSTNVYDLAKQMKERSKGAVIIVDNQKGGITGRPTGLLPREILLEKL